MLINCPRCGFSQPQDKYCAQCGVDMETYRPAAPSFSQKIFGNTGFQVGILFLIAFGAAFFLYQKRHQNLQARVEYLKGVQISSTDNQPSNKAINTNLQEDVSSLDKNPAANLPPASETRSFAAASTAAAATKEAKPAATHATGPLIRVVYAEVSKNNLQNIFDESQNNGQFVSFKDYSAGIIPNVEKRITATGVRVLHKEEYPLEVGKNLQWFYGLKDRVDPEVEIGLTTFIELSEGDGNNYRGNLEIQRSWRELSPGGGPGGIQRRSFPAIFEIGGTSGFFISSVMPLKSNLENDDELTAIDIYKILKSEDFQHGDTDFVIFVELGSNSPTAPASGSTK